MSRCSKAETEERVRKVYKLLCENRTNLEIIEYARSEWNVTHGRAYQLMNKALERIAKMKRASIAALCAEANIRYDSAIDKLWRQGKYKDAAQIMQWKNKINGLEQTNVNINAKLEVEKLENKSDEEIEEKIKEIEERLKELGGEDGNN